MGNDMIEDNQKTQLKGRITVSIVKSFKELVVAKHGKLGDGMLSYEMETALNQYIAGYRQTHTRTNAKSIIEPIEAKKQNPVPKVYKLIEDMKIYLSNTIYQGNVPQVIPENHLIMSIHALKGQDNRTFKKWYDLCERYGCIKKIGPKQFEFV